MRRVRRRGSFGQPRSSTGSRSLSLPGDSQMVRQVYGGRDGTGVDRLFAARNTLREAMERTFENPELVRRTQWHTGEIGVRRPFASSDAGRRICSVQSPRMNM